MFKRLPEGDGEDLVCLVSLISASDLLGTTSARWLTLLGTAMGACRPLRTQVKRLCEARQWVEILSLGD